MAKDLENRTLEDLERELAELEGRAPDVEIEGVTVSPRKAAPKRNTLYGSLTTALGNVPGSAVNLAKSVVEPVLHPVQTVKTLGALGAGTAQRAVQSLPGDAEIRWGGKPVSTEVADATWDYLKDRYGGADNLRRTFEQDPVGLAADVSMILTGGGAAAARVPGVVGKVGRAVETAGRAVDPIAAGVSAGKGAGKLAGKTATGTLAITTGKGSRAFTEAAKAGYEGGTREKAFKQHISGDKDTNDILDMAKGAVEKMYTERGDAYRAGMGSVNADPTVLDFQPVKDAIKDIEGLAYTRGHSGTSNAVTVNTAAAKVFEDVNKVVDAWAKLDPAEFHTPGQLDKLKQNIGVLRDSYEYGSPAYKVANDVYGAVRKQIADQAPGYAPVMDAYEKATRVTKDIQKGLSLGDKSATTSAMGKLERMLNPSNKRLGEMGSLLEKYAPEELAPSVAGASLSTMVPTGLRSMGKAAILGFGGLNVNPLLWGTIPFMSPRIAGSTAFRAGTAARVPGKVLGMAEDVYQTTPGRLGALTASRLAETQQEPEVVPEEVAVEPETEVPVDLSVESEPTDDLSGKTVEELEAMLQDELEKSEEPISGGSGTQDIIGSIGEDEALALTALGEASPNPAEQRAVIYTVLNRQKAGGFGDSLSEILRPDQFNAWENTDDLVAKMDTPEFKKALDLVRKVKAGELPDNTGGRTYFANLDLQKELHEKNPKTHKKVPDFVKGREGVKIGKTTFF